MNWGPVAATVQLWQGHRPSEYRLVCQERPRLKSGSRWCPTECLGV
jgi:hypothetical protein